MIIIIDSVRVLDSNWKNLIFRNRNLIFRNTSIAITDSERDSERKDNIGISSLVFRIMNIDSERILDSNWRNLMNIAITDSERDLDIGLGILGIC